MSIGVNWADVWGAVWGQVWQQSAPIPVAASDSSGGWPIPRKKKRVEHREEAVEVVEATEIVEPVEEIEEPEIHLFPAPDEVAALLGGVSARARADVERFERLQALHEQQRQEEEAILLIIASL